MKTTTNTELLFEIGYSKKMLHNYLVCSEKNAIFAMYTRTNDEDSRGGRCDEEDNCHRIIGGAGHDGCQRTDDYAGEWYGA